MVVDAILAVNQDVVNQNAASPVAASLSVSAKDVAHKSLVVLVVVVAAAKFFLN